MKKTKVLKMLVLVISVGYLFSGCVMYQLRKPTAENPKPGAAGFCIVYQEKRFIGEAITNTYAHNYVEDLGSGRYSNVYLNNESDDKERDSLGFNVYCDLITGLKPGLTYTLETFKASTVS